MVDKFNIKLGDKLVVNIYHGGGRSLIEGRVQLVSMRGVDVKTSDRKSYFVKWENVIDKR